MIWSPELGKLLNNIVYLCFTIHAEVGKEAAVGHGRDAGLGRSQVHRDFVTMVLGG